MPLTIRLFTALLGRDHAEPSLLLLARGAVALEFEMSANRVGGRLVRGPGLERWPSAKRGRG